MIVPAEAATRTDVRIMKWWEYYKVQCGRCATKVKKSWHRGKDAMMRSEPERERELNVKLSRQCLGTTNLREDLRSSVGFIRPAVSSSHTRCAVPPAPSKFSSFK